MFRRIAFIALLAAAPALADEFPEKSVTTAVGSSTCQTTLPVGRVLITCSTTSYVRIRESNTGTAQTAATGVTVMPGVHYYTDVKPGRGSFCATADAAAGVCSAFSVH